MEEFKEIPVLEISPTLLSYPQTSFYSGIFSRNCSVTEEEVLFYGDSEVLKWGEKRKIEFLAGRKALFLLQMRLYGRAQKIFRGENREPVFPPGFCGSVSHSKDRVFAAMGKGGTIGIDCERLVGEETFSRVHRTICLDGELESFMEMDTLEAFTRIFSLKEAFYKAVYPLVSIWFGFDFVKIEKSGDRWEVVLQKPLGNFLPGERFLAHSTLYDGYIYSVVRFFPDCR